MADTKIKSLRRWAASRAAPFDIAIVGTFIFLLVGLPLLWVFG